jgi:hypothetical protein
LYLVPVLLLWILLLLDLVCSRRPTRPSRVQMYLTPMLVLVLVLVLLLVPLWYLLLLCCCLKLVLLYLHSPALCESASPS